MQALGWGLWAVPPWILMQLSLVTCGRLVTITFHRREESVTLAPPACSRAQVLSRSSPGSCGI